MVKWEIDSTWNNHFVDPNINKKVEVLVKKVSIKTALIILFISWQLTTIIISYL